MMDDTMEWREVSRPGRPGTGASMRSVGMDTSRGSSSDAPIDNPRIIASIDEPPPGGLNAAGCAVSSASGAVAARTRRGASNTVRINGVAIDLAAIAEESSAHDDAADPMTEAAQALTIHELLRQRAVALQLIGDGDALDDDAMDMLLDRELDVPHPTPEDCRRYYDAHPARFRRNDIVYASHILLAVTDRVPIPLLRTKAEETLGRALAEPAAFEDLARERSNCPSAGVGGSLGQLLRGDSVPEFERALFDTQEAGILPRLVNTRFGFHIVRIDRRVDGDPVPFDIAQVGIARFLETRVRHKAMQQYVSILASQADIEGVDLGEANGPLVQ